MGGFVDECGSPSSTITEDFGTLSFSFSGSCDDPTSTFTLKARMCPCLGALCPLCEKTLEFQVGLAGSALCPEPPTEDCDDCRACPVSGVPADGANPGQTPSQSGPKALLRYNAGGVGHPSFPGTGSSPGGWNHVLGRYWSHDYAERVVVDPDESHVWLITKLGSFREFSGLEAQGPALRAYDRTLNSPSSEYRTLFFEDATGAWQLHDLDGTIQFFRSDGFWDKTVDRNGNTKQANYDNPADPQQLTSVDFPDLRREDFAYYLSEPPQLDGRLKSITEVGIDGTTTRTWTYTWKDDADDQDLERIDRPDGTAWEFHYDDSSFPGYLTRMDLIGELGGMRVIKAWEYDSEGRVAKVWKGDTTFGGTNAVEDWEFSYDTSTQTTVTDPVGDMTIFTYDRDTRSNNVRVTDISGGCPVCFAGPNTTFEYTDSANPLRPTAMEDDDGTRTEFTYDANGQMLTKTEDAAGTPRVTTWEYDDNFPAFQDLIQVDSTSGSGRRETRMVYDPNTGDLMSRTIDGFEGGSAFPGDGYETEFLDYELSGKPGRIDPPGFDTDDETSFTYDPTRGNLLPLTRTDPFNLQTTFAYDAFNRRIEVTDPNSVTTETEYDDLDRVTEVTEGAGSGQELVTQHDYNEFGDLELTTLPAGNRIVYRYDPAGRLEEIERQASDATPGELTVYELDDAGNRTKETLERWDAGMSDWVPESVTDFGYTTRCQLGFVTRDPGGIASTTEYAYDCDGNLERVWDANNPSVGQTALASQHFQYDALNRLETLEQPEASGTTTTYGYDVQDHLTSVTDAEGNVTTYMYSDRDLLSSQLSQASGTTTFVYNEHGELTQETDARGVVTDRAPDALDRVTAINYPATPSLDIDFNYDSPGSFALGRLTEIIRHGETLSYTYDQFGRVLQDGDLTYAYDANGNRDTITYPSGAVADYDYDFADRPETLTVGSTQIVTGATYKPSGPLSSLALANGITETRNYDFRYFPSLIEVVGGNTGRDWTYTTDHVGNITEIVASVACKPADRTIDNQTLDTPDLIVACNSITIGPNVDIVAPAEIELRTGGTVSFLESVSVGTGASLSVFNDPTLIQSSTWTFDYEAPEYYLTDATGPWGSLSWQYDEIGNRTQESRDTLVETYTYLANPATGNSPILDQVLLSSGSRDYEYGDAGHLESFSAGSNDITFVTDEEGRLSSVTRLPGGEAPEAATFRYNGRSFLSRAEHPFAADLGFVEPTYSSEGVVHALRRQEALAQPIEEISVFYFAGRPVAQLKDVDATSEWTFLTTDHLGTPLLATDDDGFDVWAGPFEPFGEDTFQNALGSGVFLRLPGQWVDSIWQGASLGADVYYNVHRWYEFGAGRYAKADPLINAGELHGSVPLTANLLARQAGSVATTAISDLALATGRSLQAPWYGYSQQAPTTFVDPMGLLTCKGTWVRTSARRAFILWPPLFWNGCRCRWSCQSCTAPDIVSSDSTDQPATTGSMINTGRGARFGDTCFCPPPGPQTGCFECEPPSTPGMRAPSTASCEDGRIVVRSRRGPSCL